MRVSHAKCVRVGRSAPLRTQDLVENCHTQLLSDFLLGGGHSTYINLIALADLVIVSYQISM